MSVDSTGCDDGLAVSRNISSVGVLMATAVVLEEGATATITFQLKPGSDERAVAGRIVRVRVNDSDPEGMWPRLIAVEFDEAVPELEPLLEEMADDRASPLSS